MTGALYPGAPFDPISDFRAVGLVASIPYLLVANAGLDGETVQEIVTRARESKRALSFATVGAGSPQHLSVERMKASMQVPITVAHYKGGAPAQQDVVAGHVDMMMSTVALAMPLVRAAKLKVLAASSAQRLASLPEVPTLIELGIADFVVEGWFGLLLPAKSSDALVARYDAALKRGLHVRAILEQMGATPVGGTPDEMDMLIRAEQKLWTKVIIDNKIKPE